MRTESFSLEKEEREIFLFISLPFRLSLTTPHVRHVPPDLKGETTSERKHIATCLLVSDPHDLKVVIFKGKG